jgi:signal transduction histidine kinase
MEVAGDDRVLATVRDISDRKRRESALQRHKHNLEQLHAVSEELLAAETHREVSAAVLDAANSVLSPAWSGILLEEDGELQPVAVEGADETEVAAPPSGERGIEQRAVETGETQVVEGTNGPELYVPLEGHGVLCLRGHDLTESNARELAEVLASHAAVALDRADREAELESGIERIDSLARAFPDFAFFFEADGTYDEVWFASGQEQTLNLTEGLVGRTVQDVLGPEPATVIQQTIDEVLQTGEVQEVEYAVDSENGQCWYEARAAPLPQDVEGEADVVLVARDVTKRREYENRLERQNERLDDFASLVSHDLRNPLNVIQGRLGLIGSTAEDESVLEHAKAAASAADRMDDLIDDLLTVARTDEQELSITEVSLHEAATRAWSAVADCDASMRVQSDGTIRADETELIRLFENLFRNSIEHAGPSVSVRVSRTQDGFVVADDGPGIDEDHRDQVFESGFSTAEQGTGYGLDIVDRVAEAHDWDISLTDSEEGACFEFTGVNFVGEATRQADGNEA